MVITEVCVKLAALCINRSPRSSLPCQKRHCQRFSSNHICIIQYSCKIRKSHMETSFNNPISSDNRAGKKTSVKLALTVDIMHDHQSCAQRYADVLFDVQYDSFS